MTGAILSYQQEGSVKLQCEIDLKQLFPPTKKRKRERERFEKKWDAFLKSDLNNNEIFELEGDVLKYQSEQLIPKKINNKPPLLLILGNPASHSVKEGMFFSFEGNKNEHRFWKIMRDSKVIDLPIEPHLSIIEQNNRRKQYLLELEYETLFRVGLCVYISMPSRASDKWSGVTGVQRLIGARAMRELEKEECQRVIECAKKFLSPSGVAVAFQKNAWNGLRSAKDPEYKLALAKEGRLKGKLKGMPNIPLLGVPPTRLSGPCSEVIRKLLTQRRYKLLSKKR